MTDEVLVIAASRRDDPNGEGRVFIYEYSQSSQQWDLAAVVQPADGGMAGDRFGFPTDIDDDTIVVGARGDDDDDGAAYIIERRSGVWESVAKLQRIQPSQIDGFANSVAIAGDYAFVGIPNNGVIEPNSGSVYVFRRQSGTWTTQPFRQYHSDTTGEEFGASIASSDEVLVVGAPGFGSDEGRAFIYEPSATPQGPDWLRTTEYRASGGQAGDRFGATTGANGTRGVVGAFLRGSGQGALFAIGQANDLIEIDFRDGDNRGFTGSVNPGTSDNIVGLARMDADRDGATLEGVTISLQQAGIRGITAARLYWSTNTSLGSSDTQLGSTITVDPNGATTTYDFDGFTQPISTSNRYLLFAIDVQASAPPFFVQFEIDRESDLDFYEAEIDRLNGSGSFTFDDQPLSDGQVRLPVELANFSAVQDGSVVRLAWETLSETNNEGFHVQHRPTGGTHTGAWAEAGFVSGFGTTTEAQRYHFDVPGLAAGKHAFRLRQTDYDGATEYGPEIEVIVELTEAFSVSPVWPNPLASEGSIMLSVRQAQHVEVALYDLLGRRVQTLYEAELPSNDARPIRIDASALPAGAYIVQVHGEDFDAHRLVRVVR